MAISYWIIGRIVRPVASLGEAAQAIASGDYGNRLYINSRDELGDLARTLNRLSEELNARTAQFSQTGDRQATVLGGMIEGVIAVDSRQRVVLANEAAGRLFAFHPTTAEGRPLLEVVRNHALHAAVTSALAKHHPARLETRSNVQHPDPHELKRPAFGTQHIDIHVQPLPGTPCPGVVLVAHDTTEIRRLEAMRRDFMANVSHELKTPLSSIKAYTETLRNGAFRDLDTSQRFLKCIEEQADRLHHLILDMLMLARLESEQQAFEIVSVDVKDVANACIDDHQRAADAKQIQLSVAGDHESGDSRCLVRADREGLREILDNLVGNAIKYTPAEGAVTIDWKRNGSMARISVRDTGIGIKPKDQPRVFERFYRVDKARSRELGGTGLGLAIVKHLVQSFGGKVSVESEPGKGSTFTVELQIG
jgi:two-component system phosphate regulon sensor histidine kinase PhoR